ncbi:hypothetical protein L208DRAFT_1303823 [Tricholoma matsutake]|nr:hypothetical protein L208DRAFT_1303823 [Tricholoma matsutake 945]
MSNQQTDTYIPDGYVVIRGDNGQHYLVPHFMIPATHQAMEAYCKKVEFNVHMAHGRVRFPSFQNMTDTPYYYALARNQLMLPADPKLTDRELLSCHAEVKALQNNLGTSYKDASHRLYMAEVEKLEQQDVTSKTYATLKERMEYNLKSFECRFSDI